MQHSPVNLERFRVEMPNAGDGHVDSSSRLEGKFMAMVCCWILGFGTLVPWNCVLTVADFYYELFPNYHPSRVLTLIYQPVDLGVIAILVFYQRKIDFRKRNIAGYILFFLSLLILTVVHLATPGKGGIGLYIGICVLMACFGVADALIQGGVVGELSFMCLEFVQSFLAGLAAYGVVMSALRLLTKAAFRNASSGLRKGAMVFLAISTFFELLCIFLYAVVFPKLPIVKYYRSKAACEAPKIADADVVSPDIRTDQDNEAAEQGRLGTKQILREKIDYAVDMFLIYALTMSIIPGCLYENTGKHSLGTWYPLVLIVMYNVWNFVSRYIPLLECLRLESSKGLMAASFGRLLLVPAFYFTAKYADQGWMIVLISILGLTHGYLTVCVMAVAPRGYKWPEQIALGNLLVMCLVGGISSGVLLGWLWII